MNPVGFLIDYFKWHYTEALVDILRVWGNFLWFTGHFFSTPTLLKTFFSAWKRMQEDYPAKGHFNFEYLAGSILVNLIMRIVGMFVRAIFIVISLTLMILQILGGVLFLALWMVAPVALFFMISWGVALIVGA